MKEIWKAIKGYEGYYEVSSLGRVRSFDREVNARNGKKRIIKGRILTPYTIRGNYFAVCLVVDGEKKKCLVLNII